MRDESVWRPGTGTSGSIRIHPGDISSVTCPAIHRVPQPVVLLVDVPDRIEGGTKLGAGDRGGGHTVEVVGTGGPPLPARQGAAAAARTPAARSGA
jgi:hypothetical protein